VLLTRRRLDERIARGAEIRGCPALELRARQLTAPGARLSTARAVRGLLEHASRRPPRGAGSAVVLERGAVRAGTQALLRLAERLEGEEQVGAMGAALAYEMLTDGTSPLYNPYSEMTVTQLVWRVHEGLDRPLVAGRENRSG